MPKSYRFRTEVGVDREVRLNIEQDFDYLEVLSLKLRQEDLYSRFCADYGVVAGRVVANGGYGVPNVSVSIFIPLDEIDENDPVISTLYPYKTLRDKNEDGYRYNLLPYEKENLGHTPTGTFPTREDILTRKEVLHIYDKYYKFTVRTNKSGDFMIVGVPLGEQKLVVDIDLSNIGKFSLRPDDLIRMGLGVKEQFNGNKFKASENIDSLPQILNEVYDIDVSSFWGEEELCDVGITRIDIDLRDMGIDIQPRCIFMGSIMSTSEDDFVRSNCKPKNDVGKLCDIVTGSGTIKALRQGFNRDEQQRPIIEEYQMDDDGYVIDDDGTWVTEIPMNLNYLTTNEFGEEIISEDQDIGIPTEGKYRFKISWLTEDGLINEIQRGSYLVPNIKEHGWTGYNTINRPSESVLNKSYAFSLDWDEYYDQEAAIRCEDTFYNFYYNKVYTVASHIDRFKWGRGRQKHLGIKEINDRKCVGDVNRFPVNDAQRNGDLLIFVFNFILTLYTFSMIQLIILVHILAVLWEIIKIIINMIRIIVNFVYGVLCFMFVTFTLGLAGVKYKDCLNPLIPKISGNPFKNIALPMLTYPDCDLCECTMRGTDGTDSDAVEDMLDALDSFPPSGALLPTSESGMYDNLLCEDSNTNNEIEDDRMEKLRLTGKLLASGYDKRTKRFYQKIYKGKNDQAEWYKSPIYPLWDNNKKGKIQNWYINTNATYSQHLNLINRRATYFWNWGGQGIETTQTEDENLKASTAIKIDYVNDQLGEIGVSDPVYDKAFIVLTRYPLMQGQLLSFNDPEKVNDINLGKTGTTISNEDSYQTVQIKGIDPKGNAYTSNVKIYNPNSVATYLHTAGVEYFQVILSERFSQLGNRINWGGGSARHSVIKDIIRGYRFRYGCSETQARNQNSDDYKDVYPEYNGFINEAIPEFAESFFVNIMVRGVDPRSPKQKIKYDLSRLFGWGIDNSYLNNNTEFSGDQTVTGEFYMNVPIQRNTNPSNTNNINDWRRDKSTPVPHYKYVGEQGGVKNRFSNANNENITTWTSNNFSTPNLWNPSFLFSFNENEQWTTFYTKAPTKYVSLDKSLINGSDADDPIDNKYFNFSDKNVKKYYGDFNANKIIYSQGTINNDYEPEIEYKPFRFIEGCGYQYSKNNNLIVGIDAEAVISVSPLYLNLNATLADPYDENDIQARTYITNKNNLVMRSDRLPSGDYWDEASEDEMESGNDESVFYRRYALHMSITTTMYAISEDGTSSSLGSEPITVGIFDSSSEGEDSAENAEDFDEGNEMTSTLLESFTCEHMVPLECYEGSGEDFQVLEGTDCEVSPFFNMSADTRLVNGCYVFVTKALILSIPEDIKHFAEYRTRLRFMFAVCRGIIGEMFQNNWVNGNLYMPSFQKKSIYGWGVDQTELVSVSFPNTSSEIVTFDYDGRANVEIPLNGDGAPYTYNLFINDELVGENVTAFPFLKNDEIRIVITGPTTVIPIGFTITLDITKYPRYKYCGDPEQRNDELKYQGPIYFNNYTNTFYYRSTPYNSQTNQYVGQKSTRIDKYNGSNEKNIWFPTTISELGPKDRFIYEVSLDPEFEAFVMDRLRSTTYGENSNLINLFIVSRLRSSNFIQNLLGLGESSIGALFSRDENTVQSRFRDARVDGDYAQLTSIASELGVTPFLEGDYSDSQVYIDSDNIGVWFESDTPLRRVITNGAVTYGIDPDGPDYIFGYSRTQEVPYYMWKMEFYTSEDNNLFGTERNTWHTTDIYSSGYQSDDFFNNVPLKYMKPNNGYGLGYIYNKTLSDDTYNQPPGTNPNFSRFKVGAPFFYYFGLKRGRTALTRFIKKYIEIS